MKGLAATSLFLILSFASVSCSGSRSTNNNANVAANANSRTHNSADAAATPNDSVDDLRNLIHVPFEPEEVVWRAFSSGQSGQRLLAVFRLMPEDSRSYASKLAASAQANVVQVSVEQWFPAELAAMGEVGGEMAVTGEAYAANDFFQAPYKNGTVIVIPDTEYFILDLQRK